MSALSTAPLRMGPREWALLGLLSVLWGGTFVFVEVALRDLPPLTLVMARVLIAATALRAWVFVAGIHPPPGRRVWPSFLVLGALNNLIPFSLIFWGQTRMTAGLAAILNATTPLWAVLLAHLLTRDERLSSAKLLGVMIGLGGAVLVIGPANLRLWGDTGLPPWLSLSPPAPTPSRASSAGASAASRRW